MLAAGASAWPHDKMTAIPALQMHHASSPLGAFDAPTPAWHQIVPKQEPHDRHSPINDSGISPGHSSNTGSSSGDPSPGSPRAPIVQIAPTPSTPTVIGQNPPPRRIVSPGAMSSSSSSDVEQFYKEPAEDALRGLQMALERSGMLMQQSGREMGDKESLQCPLCSFVASSREQFNGHLGSHYEHKCTICEFTAQGVDQLREHLKDAHDQLLSPGTEADADGSLDGDDARTPRVNNQGKVKTFRCKQCDFVTVTKLDFWEHSRGHIKLEKLLTCPKCPFVTEYKHHLEYHLRNHFGSKPFKCDKCVYSCVNKSMLNSHLKSHSNVYQYRCADCNYATKYCHSLKLHLRKYAHKPAMVLNADGSPNPLPIIDVYGTRRGPKMKPAQKEDDPPPTMVPSPGQYHMYQNPFLSAQAMMMPFPYGPVAYNPNFPAFPQAEKTQEEASMERMMSFVNNNIGHGSPSGGLKEYMAHVIARPEEVEKVMGAEMTKTEGAPLDLSKADEQSPPMAKNRRKGKAFKLELKPAKENVEEEAPRKIARLEEVPAKEVEKMVYNCSFCDIAFRDIVMYTMHMGYHGYEDPFKCNMCGQLTDDKVAFFLHIARSSHC